MTAEELESLLQFAALSGGVLMTSDRLDEIPAGRAEVFAAMLRAPNMVSSFPLLGQTGDLIVQETKRPDGTSTLNVFNPSDVVKRFDPACLGLPDVAVEVRPHASLIL